MFPVVNPQPTFSRLEKRNYDENPNSHMNITVMDSGCYSVGYGYPIMCADKMINDGATAAEVMEYLEERFEKTEILLGTFSLKFMKKSGRISAAAAVAVTRTH